MNKSPNDRLAAGHAVEFRILGSIEVLVGGERVALGGPKAKALLAALVLQPNEVISADRLVEALWGEHPPRDAANSLQGYVSQLRKALGAQHLATRAPGYVLVVEPESIDALRFERLVAHGREALRAGDAAVAVTWLSEAMGLWRGEALGEFAAHAFARAHAARLGELGLGAIEGLAEARLALGEHARVAAELPTLVEANPLRERLWGQLGLALPPDDERQRHESSPLAGRGRACPHQRLLVADLGGSLGVPEYGLAPREPSILDV